MVANKQPKISAPLSLLISSSMGVVWMWIPLGKGSFLHGSAQAFFFFLIGQRLFQACLAMADWSASCLMHVHSCVP